MIDNFCVITFADKEPYLSEAENLKNLCVNNNIQFKLYDFNWLRNSAVYYSFKDIFWKKKCGYCAWKPYAILDALKLYDKVLYLDSSMLFNPEMINKYIRENDELIFELKPMRNIFEEKQDGEQIMKLEPKYNVGDTVWIKKLDRESGNYIPQEKKIDEIAIHIFEKSNINIIYFFPLLPFNGFYEDELYATKEECQKSCDIKNKMIGA